MATGVLVASWRIGIFALAYAILFICMSRVYVRAASSNGRAGRGQVLGVAMCLLLNLTRCRRVIAAPVTAVFPPPPEFVPCGHVPAELWPGDPF
ncbi:hypothetical protein ACU4GD_31335 [Cupriavidus basilensis]